MGRRGVGVEGKESVAKSKKKQITRVSVYNLHGIYPPRARLLEEAIA